MNWLRKLPNRRRQPPGLEWIILRKLPVALLAGSLIPLFFSLGARLFQPDLHPAEISAYITRADIVAIAIAVTAWMILLTVAIGCVLVVIMKGPAYVADAYHPIDISRALTDDSRDVAQQDKVRGSTDIDSERD